MNIWQKLPRPFFALAPMEDVTDTVFRQIILRAGRPDIFFTEFTSADGMLSTGAERVMRRLQFTQAERPIIAQIWGNTPEKYPEAALIIKKMGFDGVDINMGCPIKKIIAKGFCSGLIRKPLLAQQIIRETKQAVGDFPVSVKTRIGFDRIQTEEWISSLLETQPDAITIHGRTVREQSKVPAHWDEIAKAAHLRNTFKSKTVLIGNGDVDSVSDGVRRTQQYGVEGVMIGRGIFRNLWIFNHSIDQAQITLSERITLLIDHINLYTKTYGPHAHFDRLKKYYKIYFSGISEGSRIKNALMHFQNPHETINFLQAILAQLNERGV